MTTATAALASVTIVRPDGASVPPTLERVVRSACASAWRAAEIVLSGDALRGRLDASADPRLRAGIDALLGMFGDTVATRSDVLAELRAARDAGLLDSSLDMTALVASCGRVGDAPAVVAGRRRVRTLAIDGLRRALADRPALSGVLRDSGIAALLVDAARALYRLAVRGDRDLVRWAVSPTGTTSRDQALTAFAELALTPTLVQELDRLFGDHVPPPGGTHPIVEPPQVASDPPVPEPSPPAVIEPPDPEPAPVVTPSAALEAQPVVSPASNPEPPPPAPAPIVSEPPAAAEPPLPATAAEVRAEVPGTPERSVAPARAPASWLVPVVVLVMAAAAVAVYVIR